VVAGREPVASLQHGDAAVQPDIAYVHPIQPGVHALARLEAVFAGILTDVAGILTEVAGILADVAGILADVAGILTGECGLGLARWSDRCTCAAANVLPVGNTVFIERAPVLFTSASESPRPGQVRVSLRPGWRAPARRRVVSMPLGGLGSPVSGWYWHGANWCQ
jgi:hypothetical protein